MNTIVLSILTKELSEMSVLSSKPKNTIKDLLKPFLKTILKILESYVSNSMIAATRLKLKSRQ